MQDTADATHVPPADPVDRLARAVAHAAHLLPAQGPISVFIHHNTLHAFEYLPFDRAVQRGAEVFGTQPYLSEERFREALGRGRILADHLRAELADELGERADEPVAPGVSRLALRLAMLVHPQWGGTADEVRWKLADDRVPARHPRLWEGCLAAARATPPPAGRSPYRRPRDLLLAATAVDPDVRAHEVLTRYTAAYLDQGVSPRTLPGKSAGFFRGFCDLYAGRAVGWIAPLSQWCERAVALDTPPLESALESLAHLGIPEAEWGDFLAATFLALRGWGGMVHEVEHRPDRVHHPIAAGSFVGFVAVRLMLDRAAAMTVAREELGFTGRPADLRADLLRRQPPPPPLTPEERAYAAFVAATAAGAVEVPEGFVAEVEAFPAVERRRVFQRAYERRFREQVLDAIGGHTPFPANGRPRFQAITCIDEREESFRRHLEEVAPDCQTFALAGFYGVVMYYRGAAAAHFDPLCPVVVTPKHWVEERMADESAAAEHERRAKARSVVGAVTHRLHLGSRGFAGGAVLSAGLGVLATLPLVGRVLFPRLAATARKRIGRVVDPPGKTRLKLERTDAAPAAAGGGVGYSVAEMTDVAEKQLRDAGLTRNFARLVLTLGHGSHSMNNPHESAHDCGACGGAIGGPNGRAVAHMLNDPRVRANLAARGLAIPDDTVFVGGLHNTCNEYVKLADTDLVPESHRADLAAAEAAVDEALGRNAHERARRFDSAPLGISVAGARRHMDERAEDLAQVRPEWGHATNAACVVGRRERTRGLFLDRRAFLTSYDPTQDTPDSAVLARILAAAVPVCAGINLEYYFCHVDPTGYGCGTKLPHNITSLIGVMDGAASDLRSGLPWQMVEIHEPVRLLFVIETTAEAMLGIMARNDTIDRLVRNGWVQVAVLAPDSGAIRVFRDGEFRPYTPSAARLPSVRSSADWYGGKRGYLGFAEVAAGERSGA